MMGRRSDLVASLSSQGEGWWSGRWPGSRAFRRLSKDAEVLPESEAAWISVAMIPLLVRRLAKAALPEKKRPGHARAA